MLVGWKWLGGVGAAAGRAFKMVKQRWIQETVGRVEDVGKLQHACLACTEA